MPEQARVPNLEFLYNFEKATSILSEDWLSWESPHFEQPEAPVLPRQTLVDESTEKYVEGQVRIKDSRRDTFIHLIPMIIYIF